MTKAIANNYQSLYAHRQSDKHKRALVNHPNPPADDAEIGMGDAVGGIPGDKRCADGDGREGDDVRGIPSDGEAPGTPLRVSDSIMEEVLDEDPALKTQLSPHARILAVGTAAAIVLDRRSQSESWTNALHNVQVQPRGRAWMAVNLKPADRLPRMEGSDLPANQFCEDCRVSQLCIIHQAMASQDIGEARLYFLHVQAMKAAGYCLVECGGDGDCFYHSMMLLAKLYRHDLHDAWGNHDKFRKRSCDNLLVTCYHVVVFVDCFVFT
jgi:hypothetical protein